MADKKAKRPIKFHIYRQECHYFKWDSIKHEHQ